MNGSVCGASLHRAGIDVAILARGRRYQELCHEGIVIEDPFAHRRSVTRPPAISSLDPADCYDFVLVVVRKNQVGLALIGMLGIKHGCDLAALARAKGGLRLFVAARREGHRVLRALGHRIVPWSEVAIGIMPDRCRRRGSARC